MLTASKMMMPPIVGVPAFCRCASGPSSRMCWPNSRLRRNSMNFGLRNMQISSAPVPPKRIRPISAFPSRRARGPGAAARAGRPRRRAPRARRARSRPTPREPLTSTVSPRRGAGAGQRRPPRRPRRRGPRRRGEGLGDHGGERTDGDEQLQAGGAGMEAELTVQRGPPRGRARACRRAPPPAARARSRASSSMAARIDIGLAL